MAVKVYLRRRGHQGLSGGLEPTDWTHELPHLVWPRAAPHTRADSTACAKHLVSQSTCPFALQRDYPVSGELSTFTLAGRALCTPHSSLGGHVHTQMVTTTPTQWDSLTISHVCGLSATSNGDQGHPKKLRARVLAAYPGLEGMQTF